jgi:ribA/ribD-fused uncharacterized protein
MSITSFCGEYAFLSNFYEAPILFQGLQFKNNEAAFQSMKSLSFDNRILFCQLFAKDAKKLGRNISLREDWENIKTSVMYAVVYSKFAQNVELRKKLLKTGQSILVEGNTWKDTFWGVCNGVGSNNLGVILMSIRNLFFDNKNLTIPVFNRSENYNDRLFEFICGLYDSSKCSSDFIKLCNKYFYVSEYNYIYSDRINVINYIFSSVSV